LQSAYNEHHIKLLNDLVDFTAVENSAGIYETAAKLDMLYPKDHKASNMLLAWLIW